MFISKGQISRVSQSENQVVSLICKGLARFHWFDTWTLYKGENNFLNQTQFFITLIQRSDFKGQLIWDKFDLQIIWYAGD